MSIKLIEQVVELTNVERAKEGLQPLKLNDRLLDAAQDHSNDMAQDDFFSHTGADGSTVGDRVRASGYQYSTAGENIAAGQTTAAQVVEGWMNSPGHRANILNPNYTEIGVGYEYLQNDTGSVNYNHYWTQVFGTPSNNNAGSQLESPTPIPQPDPVESIEEVEAIDEVSDPSQPDLVESIEQVEAIDEVSNPQIEEKGELVIENTADNGSESVEDINNDLFELNNSTSSKISYSYSVSSNGYWDSLTGQTDSALTGGDITFNLLEDGSEVRSVSWYIEQYKDDFSELLNDSSLGSAVNIQDSDSVDLVEYISNSDLTQNQKDLVFETLDSFM